MMKFPGNGQSAQPPAAPRVLGVPGSAPLPAAPLPLTVQDIFALRIRREELSSQLISATSRRQSTANQLRTSITGADRAGLEDRLAVLDKRIAQIEGDIAETGRQLTTAPSQLLSSAGNPGRRDGPSPGQITAMGIVGTLFVAAPLAIAFARLIWRRGMRFASASPAAPDITNRLERMEQGIEVIALEVERISEGQRFVAQLMSDGARRGTAEPARIAEQPAHGG